MEAGKISEGSTVHLWCRHAADLIPGIALSSIFHAEGIWRAVVGAAGAAALWAAIGVGVGALARNQVPTLIGISAWMLFVEGLLAGDVADNLGDIGRLLPGAAAAAVSGQDPGTLLAPGVGLVLLVLYAAAAALAGAFALSRRDVG
jgi:ABC-2 type transport system permease protein